MPEHHDLFVYRKPFSFHRNAYLLYQHAYNVAVNLGVKRPTQPRAAVPGQGSSSRGARMLACRETRWPVTRVRDHVFRAGRRLHRWLSGRRIAEELLLIARESWLLIERGEMAFNFLSVRSEAFLPSLFFLAEPLCPELAEGVPGSLGSLPFRASKSLATNSAPSACPRATAAQFCPACRHDGHLYYSCFRPCLEVEAAFRSPRDHIGKGNSSQQLISHGGHVTSALRPRRPLSFTLPRKAALVLPWRGWPAMDVLSPGPFGNSVIVIL